MCLCAWISVETEKSIMLIALPDWAFYHNKFMVQFACFIHTHLTFWCCEGDADTSTCSEVYAPFAIPNPFSWLLQACSSAILMAPLWAP